MKSLLTFLFIVVTSLSANAGTAARDFGPYLSGGLSKVISSVSQPGVDASLNGSGSSVEVGFDLPLSENFGFTLGVELAQKQLRNTAQSSTYLDDTKLNTRALRGSFFLRNLYLGGSYQQAGIDLQTISTTAGSSSAHMDATGSSLFVGYGIRYKNILRAQVEGESARFSTPGFTYTDYSIGLKLQLIFSGLFER